ncbi:MAG: M15 family metallopeptidase [Flavobacteriaceae bacterium]
MKYLWYFIPFFLTIIACKENRAKKDTPTKVDTVLVRKSLPSQQIEPVKRFKSLDGLADTTFVRLADFGDGFAYDMRYATENNFLKAKVYECAECYTRVKTARALMAANADFKEHGVKIKFFDCYRPNSVQYLMWEIVPNPQYVADPVKGSIHNKGGAVDITLVTLDGEALDMGTDFDFFGRLAYHDNLDLPQNILENRKLLKETMEKHGFWSVRTEWWHYNLGTASNDKVADFKWNCDQ